MIHRGACSPKAGKLFGGGCQNRFGIPFWGIGEFTTHFRFPILVGIGKNHVPFPIWGQ